MEFQNRTIAGAGSPLASVDDRGRVIVNSAADGDLFKLFIPFGAVGANKIYFDLWNGDARKKLQVVKVVPIPEGDTAVTGVVSVELYLQRTTAIGTGGTAAVAESTALTTTPALSKVDPAVADLDADITARLGPSGGATGGAVLAMASVFTEETNAAAYDIRNMVDDGASIVVPPGTGLRVIQGSVTSVSAVGFNVLFSIINQ